MALAIKKKKKRKQQLNFGKKWLKWNTSKKLICKKRRVIVLFEGTCILEVVVEKH